jgi:arylsulfatase A-like enzyme
VPAFLASALAIPAALLVLLAAELAQLPLALWTSAGAGRASALVSGTAAWVMAALWVPLAYQAAVTLLLASPSVACWRPGAPRLVVLAVASGWVAHATYRVLTLYEPFRGHLPFVAALIALALFLTAGFVLLGDPQPPAGPRRRVMVVLAATGLGGAALAYLLDHLLYRGLYPTLHLTVLWGAFLLCHLGLVALIRWSGGRSSRARHYWLGGVSASAVAVALVSVIPSAEARAEVAPWLSSFTLAGQTRVVGRGFDPAQEEADRRELADDTDAEARFARANHLPELAAGFRLEDHNLLLITCEALRFDQTSLADASLDTTPELLAFADRGAWAFTRAYSPSSGTLDTGAALMAMTYPSMTGLTLWQRHWQGELPAETVTVAEALDDAGYATHLISYDHDEWFRRGILGLDQGFTRRDLFSDIEYGDDADRDIAAAAMARLGELERSSQRFFAWVFFGSPHAEYAVHDPSRPSATPMDRYRQEVRFADARMGELLRALEASPLWDNTVVIIAGDHGEELGEHGGTTHTNTVFGESTHVLLLVRVPGLPGARVSAPTSVLYVLPWLLLEHGGAPAQLARERLRHELGPMLAATNDAVVVELLGPANMHSSLVWQDLKVNLDLLTGRLSLFDLRRDPGEQDDLWLRDPLLAPQLREAVSGYRRVRASRRHYSFAPEKVPAPPAKQRR